MNIVVVGLGSMGRRRIRLIKQYNNEFNIIGVDLNEERRTQAESETGIKTSGDLEKTLSECNIDCAFVCTAPLSHSKIINTCLQHKTHVFTELNLVADGYEENIKLANENNKVLFLSSTFLYRAEVKKINELVENQKTLLNYSYHIGQYLPDWHPWESYKDFFVGNKRTNGCREIFAIELPWLVHTFGKVKDIKVVKGKMSSLDIEYNDNYLLIIEHETGHKGTLVVDIVSRKAVRNLEIVGEELYLSWDGSGDGLKLMNLDNKTDEVIKLYEDVVQLENYSKFVVENAYSDEIKVFFECIEGKTIPIHNFEKDKIVLDLIDRIEA